MIGVEVEFERNLDWQSLRDTIEQIGADPTLDYIEFVGRERRNKGSRCIDQRDIDVETGVLEVPTGLSAYHAADYGRADGPDLDLGLRQRSGWKKHHGKDQQQSAHQRKDLPDILLIAASVSLFGPDELGCARPGNASENCGGHQSGPAGIVEVEQASNHGTGGEQAGN